MKRILNVAAREYTSTVTTKGFLFGILLTPLLIVAVISALPLLINKAAPKVTGEVALIDRTGLVAPKVEKSFTPEQASKRRAERAARINRAFSAASTPIPLDDKQKAMAQSQMQSNIIEQDLRLRTLPKDASVETEKAPIAGVGGKDNRDPSRRLALIVVPEGSIKPENAEKYQAFYAERLDFEVKNDIEGQVNRAIVDARIEASGMDAARVRKLIERPEAEAKDVTREGGERTSAGELAGTFVPMAFMMLVWISVFTSGQYLLTSLIEEKSNRVMELLLSAVSPTELMSGKIVGQMGVGLTILLFYASLGGGALVAFQRLHLLEPMSLVYLAIFFVLAFTMIAAMMAAIGSAVADVREAQSLMGPVMIVLMIPMMLWMPIQRNPNSMFAQIISFIPPINPFVMVLRLTGAEKVPAWQIPASILVGVVSCAVFVWGAAKIFRVGVLMYGKPPSLLGLLKWIRYA